MFKTEFFGARPSVSSCLVLAVALASTLAGCAFGRDREERLRSAAESLLPPEAAIVGERYGDCTEFAPSPSCVTLFFAAPSTGFRQRVELVRERAREEGWDPRPEGSWILTGGAGLAFVKHGLRAFVSLSRKPASSCGDVPLIDCVDIVDHVQVRFR